MISFDNTEIAFRYKSDKDLKRAYRLYRLVGKSWLVRFGKWATPIAFKLGIPISGIIKSTVFKQFCGGESIEECEETIETLYRYNVGTILDYSVEGKTEEEGFEETSEEIISTLKKAEGNPAVPFAVFKLTGITSFSLLEKLNDEEHELSALEEQKYAEVVERVDRICSFAQKSGTPVFIDAEESWIQNTIDRIVEQMMEKYNKDRAVVFNTIQMYRHDRLDYLKKNLKDAKSKGYTLGVKLVRGAYMEKERERAAQEDYPSPIQPDKISCDNDFNAALVLMMDAISYCSFCAGTHNEESSLLLTELMENKGLSKNDERIYFAQLLGMSDHISFNLAHHNFQVAKYVPYGPIKEVMPYLLRRADENTSVKGQTGRELSLLMIERKRRKL